MQVMDLKAAPFCSLVNKKNLGKLNRKNSPNKNKSQKKPVAASPGICTERSSHFFGMEKSIFLRNLQQDPLNGPLNLSI